MVSFTKLIVSALLVASAPAAPWPTYSKHSTHNSKRIGRGLMVEIYHPKTSYRTFGVGKDVPTGASLGSQSLEDATMSVIANELSVDPTNIGYTNGYKTADGLSYAYAKQMHEGVTFVNAVANVAFKADKLVAFGSSFVDISNIASSRPSVNIDSFISNIESQLNGKYNGVKDIKYLSKPDGSAALTHAIQVQNDDTNAWYEALVDAHTGELVSVVDFVADATYTVLPITKQSIQEGLESLQDPEDFETSPNGWILGGETAGNNVISYKGGGSSTTLESADGVFNYTYDVDLDPTDNVDAARVNGFYLVNKLHDVLYRYGWTEDAFNFQTDNFGMGGKGRDRVLMSVQDASGINNANFATPPDGQSGRCRMYIWTHTHPRRDGSMENDIPVHEFTHGLTNRMTGGGTGACLQTTESRGMGEGWSDTMASWTEKTSGEVADFTLGAYVVDNPAGIRSHPYSTDPAVNPLRYSSIQLLYEVHDIGEIWANMLHNVYAQFVAALGWSAIAMSDATGAEGNIVFLHLFIDALALQPCNPTFVDARDAWIQADQNRYDGWNRCLIWGAFASRGLGVGAVHYRDDYSVPSDC